MIRRGFTLLELITAVLLGSLVMLIIAGGLRSAIRSWETVQNKVSYNYNRRSVLDLVKRQTTSLFYKEDAAEFDRMANARGVSANSPKGRNTVNRNANTRNNINNIPGGQAPRVATSGFIVPDGASFFSGNIQELNFLSTVSFLSDFPGQVAVRYYVVQGNPGEDETIADLPHTRTVYNDDFDEDEDAVRDDLDFGYEELMEPLEGQLYLYVEEKNLFLAATMEDSLSTENDPFAEIDADEDEEEDLENDEAMGDAAAAMGIDGEVSEIFATNSMKLIGPLRAFTIRYLKNDVLVGATDFEDEEEVWDQAWDVDRQGGYPRAVEMTLIFEPEGDPEDVADIPSESLDAVRMVLPIFSDSALTRSHAGVDEMGEESLIGGDDGDR